MRKFFILVVLAPLLWLFLFGNGSPAIKGPSENFPAAGAQKIPGKTKPAVVDAFGNTPLYFIPNQGQMDKEALFCARTTRYNLWITKQGLVFDSIKQVKTEDDDTKPGKKNCFSSPYSPHLTDIKRDVSRLIFLNACKNPLITAEDSTSHLVNYFKGDDKTQWYTRIPTSHVVCYRDIYKNIDLKVYGIENLIEYDWVVKPGGNPGNIRFQYQEIKKTFIDDQGNLIVKTAFGQWIHKKPLAYQNIINKNITGSTHQRIEVDVEFKKTGSNTYSFHLGEYDKSTDLIIDPMVVAFSTYLGGSLNEELLDISVDSTGAVIAVGYTYSANFPTVGGYQSTLAGPSDSFITKFSVDGSGLVFSTYLGGSNHDGIKSIWLGSGGIIYVGGVTLSTDFPTVTPFQASNTGGPQEGFISKLSADGSTLLYSTYLGGSSFDYIEGIAVCSSGEICVTGLTHSSDFPLQNAIISTYDGGGIESYGDAFVTKLSSTGSSLVYSTYLGKNGFDSAYDLTVDSSGAVYVVGTTACSDFPNVSAYQQSLWGGLDGFITKFPASGTPLVFSTFLGGITDDSIFAITLDASGNIFITGRTSSDNFPVTPDVFQTSKLSGTGTNDYDGFVSKFTSSGALLYSTYLGGTGGITETHGITVNSSGNAVVTGFTESPNFPLQDAFHSQLDGARDAIIAEISFYSSSLNFSSYLGSGNNAVGKSVDTHNNSVYLAGNSNDLLPTYQGYQDTFGGVQDGFVTKVVYSTYSCITVTAPDGSENWQVGTDETITWTAPTTINNVKIEYSVDSGTNWTTIIDSTPNSGSYTWTIPDTVSSNCLVSISDVESGYYSPDESDGEFSIFSDPLELTYPNGGQEFWQEAQTGIEWNTTGDITEVELYYSTDNGNTWNLITGPFSNSGYYDWDVPTTPSTECLVKVKDANSTAEDISDAVFTIKAPTITVTYPDGGQILMQESYSSIEWSHEGNISQVLLYYSTDSGSTWNLIDGPIANNHYYDWLVPTTPSTECLVKVADAAGFAEGISDGIFIIRAPAITVEHPNGGQVLMQDNYSSIEWSHEGNITQVLLYYSTDSGSTWNLVAGPIANNHVYDWLIPPTPSTECLVKVADAAGYAEDISDGIFTIRAPSITVSHPNGGQVLMQESFTTIEWASEGNISQVLLYYSTDSGNTWNFIEGPVSNSHIYDWVVPPTPSTQCLVKVMDAAGYAEDISDGIFTIRAPSITVTHPNGGQVLMQESFTTIEWASEGNISQVLLYYSTDSGNTWNFIEGPVSNSHIYDWIVPPTPSTQCLVKVLDAAGYAEDISDGIFTILPPSINVDFPNGGEEFTTGNYTQISWTFAGNIVNVNLYLSTDSGFSWDLIDGPIPNNNYYDWLIPDSPSTECLIRVADAAGYAEDESNGIFSILAPGVSSSQRDTLIALYNSTNGDSWIDNTNWRLPGDPSQFNDPGTEHTWYGVTCTPDNLYVTEINLPSNNLNGSIADLSALSQLTKLDLNGNQLNGTLPANLNNLANLQVLDLGTNFITGNLPDLSGLVNLTYLNLSTNLFNGNIPTWISTLTSLNTLNLSENQFSGTLADLSSLSQLTELNVGNNQLSGTIPAWVNSLTSLSILNLGYNQFSGELPDLGNLTQLTDLNLYANQFTGSIPTWINLLTALTKLDLSSNQFTGTIPDISSLTSLKEVYLHNNDLSGVIPDLNTLTSLEYVYMNNNQLSGSIPNINGLTNLQRLDLSGNLLSGSIPSEIGSLTALRYLFLHGNQLGGSLPSSLTSLTNLIDDNSSIRWNALYTDDPTIRDFMNAKQYTGDWESTQTIAPTDVTTGDASHDSITVSWTPISYQVNSGGYRVYYTTTPGSGYTLSGATIDKNTDNYTVTELNANTTYYFVVESFTDPHVNNQNSVVSEYSLEVSATTLETPTLTITAPNGGQNWEASTIQAITWNSTGAITDVKIEYSADSGTSWNTVTASTPNNGNYNWTVPNTPSTTCLIKISDVGAITEDTSDDVFTIAELRTLTVIAPNGTENWEGGFLQTITWSSTGSIANVLIEYSTDNGSSWNTIISSTPNNGAFGWLVPNTPSSDCLVRISDLAGPAADISNGVFTIFPMRTITVITPNDSEDWMVGSTHDITWTTTGAVGNVLIDYSTDGGYYWNSVVMVTPNTGSYTWTIPDTPSTNCMVQIIDSTSPVLDRSDGVFTISIPKISQTQRDALIALYNSTLGDTWTNSTNWHKPGEPTQFNDPGTENTWFGITCNAENTQVEKIELSTNNLWGTLPDLSDLTALQVLNLNINHISGSIPSSLNNLVNLNTLDLYYNQLSGPIPDLSSLVQLEKLDLGANDFTGEVPAWLNTLVNLTSLRLSNNNLSGTIPDLTALTQLQHIDLSINQFTGSIPAWFNQLSNIKTLYLQRNQFSGTILDLSNLSQMTNINLSENQLTGSVPAWLNNLTNLGNIQFQSNQLAGTIPDLSSLTNLWLLNLSDNQLTGNIPTGIGNLTGLLYLYLNDNQLNGNIPAELGNLTILGYLKLNGNQLIGSLPGTLSNLTNLATSGLNISWNGLYTDDSGLRDFLNSKHFGGDWVSTQTIAPIDLSTSEETHESIKIAWTPIQYQADSGGYLVYYSTTSGSGYTLAGTTSDKTIDNYTVTGLAANTNYYFVIETVTQPHADNQNTVTSEYSTEISAVTYDAPTITVIAPNGGVSWEATTTQIITWNSTGNITDIKIEYSTDNGTSWNTVTASTTNSGSFDWTVPNTPSTNCLIKISDIGGLAEDTSDGVFSITELRTITVSSPNGTENWEGSTNQNINWNSTGSIPNVMIEYSTDNGGSWNTVTASAVNNGTYNWAVPNTPSTNCLIRISDTAEPATDTSNAVFTITEQRTVTVITPNGTETWEGGTSQDITWSSTGSIPNVIIEYSADNGSSWNTITSSTVNNGTFNWTVLNTPSTTCLVRISDTAGPAFDISDAVFTISPAQISQSQRDALIALYNSTNGDSWTNNTNWRKPGEPTEFNDPGTEHTWFGVTCNADNTVVEILQIENNNLIGNIPIELNNLTGLTILILRNNQLTGTMPDLSSLANLVELKLNVNQLEGTIPAWLNNLTNLQALHLDSNQFTGPIPDLTGLVNLNELFLAANPIGSTIPVWLNNMTNLTKLKLDSAQLTGSIPDLSNLSQLRDLYLASNQLTGTIPDLSGMISLERFQLSYNQLSGTIPSWINNLTSLLFIEFQYNQFTGTIPYLGNLTLLRKLNLNQNQLTGPIPTELGNLSNLQSINLENNQLDGSIPPGLGNLPVLFFLSLSENQLTGNLPPELGNLSSLSYLLLENNQFEGSIPSEFGNLTGLMFLLLNGNQLKGSIPGTLSNLTSLIPSNLNISWNGLYTDDTNLRDFLNSKQYGGDWESTQTIAPTGLSSSEETHNSVKISWTPIQYQSDSGGYRVYYSTTSGSGYTPAGTTADKTIDNYTVTGLDPDTTYYFVVEAFTDNHADNQNTVTSEYSQEISTATQENPTLTISTPNGGQSWEATTSQTITWNSTGNITDVKIEYSIDNGIGWSTVSASTPNNGSFSWTIPNTPSVSCLVKITDIGGLAEDTSDGVFAITEQRTLTITAPNGTESWEGNTAKSITWNSTGIISDVKLEYSTDNGSSWNIITASTANNGSYSWTVPNTPSTNCLVRISDTAGPATDTSNAVFNITEQRTLTVTAPNGTETWEGGSMQTITWNSTGSIANVKIEYSTNNGTSWNTAESSTTNDGNFNWTVPNTPSTNCLVRISDTAGSATDTSNAVFTITEQRTLTVTAPNGTETWEGGSMQTITWNSTGSIANVKIEYSTNNGTSWNTAESSTTNDGNFNWTVPNTPSTNCLVRISDTAGPATDTSNAVFTITEQRTLTITAPNGTETWEGGSMQTITWNSTGSIANVKIEYSTNTGTSWNTAESSTTNDGNFNWTVPNTPSTNCLIRISDTAGSATDTSNAVFTIIEQRTVTVNVPNGGQRWFIDSTYSITWTTTGSIATVMIEYSTNNGSTWDTITSSVTNSGSYNWTIPDTPSTNCLVKISDTSGPAIDVSNSVFTIDPYPTITVQTPNGGQSWVEGTTQAITWTYTGTIANVDIEYSSNGGTSWNSIVSSTTNTGSYNWIIPAVESANCLVRVNDTATSASDVSDAVFTLWKQPSITVTVPNNGEVWLRNTQQTITWTTTGNITDVAIQYSIDAGSNWYTVVSSTPNNGSYQWWVPSVNKDKPQSLVKIMTLDGTVVDTSDNYFTISKF